MVIAGRDYVHAAVEDLPADAFVLVPSHLEAGGEADLEVIRGQLFTLERQPPLIFTEGELPVGFNLFQWPAFTP
jgi:hypothetical protein